MPKKTSYAGRPGQGLNWAKIREEYAQKATPEELEGPFDERGNLKPKNLAELNEEIKIKNRGSRAKPDAMTRQEAGAKKSHTPNKTPKVARDAMVKLYGEGVPMNEIGRRLGFNGATVRGVLIQEGVHTPQARSGKSGTDQ